MIEILTSDQDLLLRQLWHEIIGPDAKIDLDCANGDGDSFEVVLFMSPMFETMSLDEAMDLDLDHLDVLQADGRGAPRLLVEDAAPTWPRG